MAAHLLDGQDGFLLLVRPLNKSMISRMTRLHLVMTFLAGLILGYLIKRSQGGLLNNREGFAGAASSAYCGSCKKTCPCNCQAPRPTCPPCREPDLSMYVLKSSIPPCPTCPDLSNYMLKTECPPVPDLSKYVLKSSIPKQGPIILDCSKCKKPSGECPPCPRPRCPEVKCPAPTKCSPCAPCPRQECPPAVVKCKAEEVPSSTVRPYLAPLNVGGFGSGL